MHGLLTVREFIAFDLGTMFIWCELGLIEISHACCQNYYALGSVSFLGFCSISMEMFAIICPLFCSTLCNLDTDKPIYVG